MTDTPSGRRWWVLAAYAAVAGVSQMLWLNFAPLIDRLQARYGVGQLLASATILVFPLLYLVLSIPAGIMIDKRGYRFAVGLGAVLMAVFACVRIWDATFWALLVGQTGIAVAQPFVVNGVTKLVADWFDAQEAALATGLGTVGMFLGMAVGMAGSPIIADAYGLRGAMLVFGAISVAAALAFLVIVRERGQAGEVPTGGTWTDFKRLLKNRHFVVLLGVSFVGLGMFNGLLTWLELILAPNGIDAQAAGIVGAVIIVGGIVGAGVIPALADKFRRRKPFLVFCFVPVLALLGPMCSTHSVVTAGILGAAFGFVFLPALALGLTISEDLSGARLAGVAAGLVMLTGNGGGTVVPVVMQIAKGQQTSWRPAVDVMLALLVCGLLLSVLLPETFGRHAQPQTSSRADGAAEA